MTWGTIFNNRRFYVPHTLQTLLHLPFSMEIHFHFPCCHFSVTFPPRQAHWPFLLSAGRFYYLIHPTKLTYDEAVQACLNDGAQIAKVGQIFVAWKLLGYDRCDAGWLADGSVRYPISRPRRRCSPTEAAVRFVGFPDKKHKLYGVYCFRAYNWACPQEHLGFKVIKNMWRFFLCCFVLFFNMNSCKLPKLW